MVDARHFPGPERKKYLELCVKCLKRAERRICRSKNFEVRVAARVHAYTLAVQALRIKRSEFAAELAGLPWKAKPFKPLSQPKPPL